MPYVITQACCNDAGCVSVCPANCIHPTPAEPEFLTADMLYIDDGTGRVPNSAGRVECITGTVEPGVSVTGWIKRGATGGIGVNRWCAEETARSIVADHAAGLLPEPTAPRTEIPEMLVELVRREDLYAAANDADAPVPVRNRHTAGFRSRCRTGVVP